jgi:predicted dehydrogenase
VPNHHLDAVIVGLGRAGGDLHIPILHKINRSRTGPPLFGRVAALVDLDTKRIVKSLHRLSDDYNYDPSDVIQAAALADLSSLSRDTTVIHICTPASNHLATLQEAATAGFKLIIVEKPCAGSIMEVDAMRRLADENGLNVAVVNPYLYSRSVETCRKLIAATGQKLMYLEFELSKPRKQPAVDNRSAPESVFDVELPHAIATALYLVAPQTYGVLRADVRHMHYRDRDEDPCLILNHMGLGIINLQLDQCVATLVSYLDHPNRVRCLRLRLQDQREFVASFPVSEDDHTAVVDTYGSPGPDGTSLHLAEDKYPDDLFTRCLTNIYSRFFAGEPLPTDLEFNRKVIDIMDRAKSRCRVRT